MQKVSRRVIPLFILLTFFFNYFQSKVLSKSNNLGKLNRPTKEILKKKDRKSILIFAVQPCWAPEKVLLMFGPLADYLSKAIGLQVKLIISDNYKQFHSELYKVDIALQDAYSTYVHMKSHVPLLPIAVAVSRKGSPTERGAIIVRDDSSIRSLKDLVGKSFLFGAIHNTPKFFSIWILLKKSGIDPPRDFSKMAIGGECSANAMAVFVGDYDAGAVCADFFEENSEKDLKKGLRVLAYTDPSPNWLFTVRVDLDKQIKAHIKKAILSLKPGTELSKKILQYTVWTGFIRINGKELKEIDHLVKKYSVPTQEIFEGFQKSRF